MQAISLFSKSVGWLDSLNKSKNSYRTVYSQIRYFERSKSVTGSLQPLPYVETTWKHWLGTPLGRFQGRAHFYLFFTSSFQTNSFRFLVFRHSSPPKLLKSIPPWLRVPRIAGIISDSWQLGVYCKNFCLWGYLTVDQLINGNLEDICNDFLYKSTNWTI